jgi:integrase
MARNGKLTAMQVDSAALAPKRHSDGGNLYLDVRADGRRSWVFLYRFGPDSRQREAGLGKAGKGGVSLAAARLKAAEGRAMLSQRPPVDPLSVWKPPAAPPRSPTFAKAAESYIALHGPSWKNDKHRAQWVMTLAEYCRPLHSMPVDEIRTPDVLNVLQPIWRRAPETASRLRGRIEMILDYARADDEDARPNPARWKGHLANKLPNPKEIGKLVKRDGVVETVARGHHPALSYQDAPVFAARLRAQDGIAARALEFLLLTACRTGEVLGAQWSEVDLDSRLWTIPATRLKTGRKTRKPHVVPLSPRALAIIAEMGAIRSSDFVFPSGRAGRPLSHMALLMLLKARMGYTVTVHGFRSSFRDFAGDKTDASREVAEAALGHAIRGVEASYRRQTAVEKRRQLMNAWGAYCESLPGDEAPNVVPFELRSPRAII